MYLLSIAVTNYLNTQQLKITKTYCLTVPVGQESGHGLAGSSFQVLTVGLQSNCPPDHGSLI